MGQWWSSLFFIDVSGFPRRLIVGPLWQFATILDPCVAPVLPRGGDWQRLPVGVGAGDHSDNDDPMFIVINAIDDSIRSPPGAVPIIERGLQALADSVRILQQRPDDELVSRESYRLGQSFGELSASSR